MTTLAEVRRIVVIADTAIEKPLLENFLKLGAKGYNCVYCFGKGRHETLEDPFTGQSRVRIEIIARQSVAEAIMDYVHRSEFESYAATAFMDVVQVHAHDIASF